MTIKELADELGYSKQRIQQIIDKLPTNKRPLKQGNRFIITQSNAEDIKFLLGVPSDKQTTNERQNTSDDIDLLVKQLESKDEQIKMLHKLLDQQQQLTLQANKKIEQLELSLNENELEEEEIIESKKEVSDISLSQFDESKEKKLTFLEKLFGRKKTNDK